MWYKVLGIKYKVSVYRLKFCFDRMGLDVLDDGGAGVIMQADVISPSLPNT